MQDNDLETRYWQERNDLLSNLDKIADLEKRYTTFLLDEIILPSAENIWQNFEVDPFLLLPFWRNYPPEQRGNKPIGETVPWLELGEKTISSNIIWALGDKMDGVTFPGLPTGGDIRFANNQVYVHLDVKLTGPNDNDNEVVVPPNQVSGDGAIWNNGVINNSWPVRLKNGTINFQFQPKLPPFYILKDQVRICLTYFFDAIYAVEGFGKHPIKYFELVCVPNGLLMFNGPCYADKPGLMISGKDEKTKPDDTKRVRIRLNPLSKIDGWRATKIVRIEGKWQAIQKRNGSEPPALFSED